MTGGVTFGAQPGSDVLGLAIHIGQIPAGFSFDRDTIVVDVTDDDEIYQLTIPAASFSLPSTNPPQAVEANPPIDGLASASFAPEAGGGGVLTVTTLPTDLSSADRTPHVVSVALEMGTYRFGQTRLWQAQDDQLGPVEQ